MIVCFKNMDSTIYLDLSYPLPHHTDLGFPDKTAQEQKSSTIRVLLQQLVFIQPAASEKVSNMKKAGEGGMTLKCVMKQSCLSICLTRVR